MGHYFELPRALFSHLVCPFCLPILAVDRCTGRQYIDLIFSHTNIGSRAHDPNCMCNVPDHRHASVTTHASDCHGL